MPELRKDLITEGWVIIATERGKRPHGSNKPQYNLILQTAPLRAGHRRSGYWDTIDQDFRWHIKILPRLTWTAGFEWGTGFYINPMAPEEATSFLRGVAL